MSRNHLLKPIVWIACLEPLAQLAWEGLHNALGANPIERITRQTGWWTLVLLLTSLAITPLRRLTRLYWLVQYRRLVGLFAFFYGSLHLVTYVWLDQFFDVSSMLRDVAKRPFITVGTLAYLSMLPLALTSTQWSIRKLGKNWQVLHRLAYVSAIAGVVHFYWLVKLDEREPLTFAAVLAVLFAVRAAYAVKERMARRAPARPSEATLVAD